MNLIPHDYTLHDCRTARAAGMNPNDLHAPYTLSFSGLTLCLTCTHARKEALPWWKRPFVNWQVLWPCEQAKR